MRNRPILTTILWIATVLLFVALVALFQQPSVQAPEFPELSYAQLLKLGPQLRTATIRGDTLTGYDTQNHPFTTRLPNDPAIATRLAQGGADVRVGPAPETSWLTTLLTNLVPLILYFLLFGLPLFRIAQALEALAGSRLRPAGKAKIPAGDKP